MKHINIFDLFKDFIIPEKSDVQPLSVGNACRIKILTIILCSIALVCVLFVNIYRGSINFGNGNYLSKSIVAIVLTLLHIFYLWLVFRTIIIDRPVENLFWQFIIFPVLLATAYSAYAAEIAISISYNVNLAKHREIYKNISYLLFFISNLLWFIRDVYEVYKCNKKSSLWWIIGELITITIFGIVYCGGNPEISIFDVNIDLHPFNGPVFAYCIVYFLSIMFNSQSAEYANIYKSYLDSLYIPHNMQDMTVQTVIDEEQKDILDFGCGCGKRIFENLTLLGNIIKKQIPERNIKSITGIDEDQSFGDSFCECMKKYNIRNFNFYYDININKMSKYNIIFISHVLYDERAFLQIKKFLSKVQPGALIFIRGSSPYSLFVIAEIICTNRLFSWYNFGKNKNRPHLWYAFWYKSLINDKELSLEIINKTPYIVNQVCDIQKTENRNGISTLLSHLYQNLDNSLVNKYLSGVYSCEISNIPNYDWIYVLRKK
jgi:2-polyprenyl-3-methyl-5-hydroxy-6-metoxy-1,4-benzoquinol methylase